MRIIIQRIKWLLFKRKGLVKIYKGFSAHRTSFADEASTFDEYTRLGKDTRVSHSTIGKCTYVVGAEVRNADVGSFCSIGREVLIGGLGKHPTQWLSTHPVFYSPLKQSGISFVKDTQFDELVRTEVGHDVWIGARAMVLDGVTIGNGAIIAAGAVVVKDVEPYSIVGGVPAKEIRKRFDDKVIDSLNSMEWWNLPFDILEKISDDFIANEKWIIDDLNGIKDKIRELRCQRSQKT